MTCDACENDCPFCDDEHIPECPVFGAGARPTLGDNSAVRGVHLSVAPPPEAHGRLLVEEPEVGEAEEPETDRRTATRALLRALGYDPATHDLWVVQHPIAGVRVVDSLNEPIKFFAERALKRLGDSEVFTQAYADALAAEELAARPIPDVSSLLVLKGN